MKNLPMTRALVKTSPVFRSTLSLVWSDLSQIGRGITLTQRLFGSLIYLGVVALIARAGARFLFLDML